MDWMGTAQGIIALITALLGLVGTGITAYVAIRAFLTAAKEKSSKEIWAMIMNMANAAMKEAERTGESGATKKEMVIESVKAGCKAANLNIDDFLDQLGTYIDQSIKFVNDMTKSPE